MSLSKKTRVNLRAFNHMKFGSLTAARYSTARRKTRAEVLAKVYKKAKLAKEAPHD